MCINEVELNMCVDEIRLKKCVDEWELNLCSWGRFRYMWVAGVEWKSFVPVDGAELNLHVDRVELNVSVNGVELRKHV